MDDVAVLRAEAVTLRGGVLRSWEINGTDAEREVARDELRARQRAQALMASMTGVVTPLDDPA